MQLSTVIISTYNGEKYIEEQLESIRNQTKLPSRVIISDDCSTDKTVLIIRNYITRYNLNWELIENKNNVGWCANFYRLIELCNTKYVFFCDQDDIWDINKIKIMEDKMNNNENIEVLCSNYTLFYSTNDASRVLEKTTKKLKMNGSLDKVKLTKKNFYIRRPGCTFCIRDSIINKAINYFSDDLPHDALFWRLAILNNSLFIINSSLINWRRHSNNASTKKIRKKENRLKSVNADIQFSNLLIANDKFISNKNVFKKFVLFCKLRKKFLLSKNFILWVKLLILYRNFYVSLKACFGDAYLCYFKKYSKL